METNYRLKRAHRQAVLSRQRRRAAGVVVFALLTAWLLNISLFNPTAIEAANENYRQICVREGDTLWTIALRYKPDDSDTRDFVRLVADTNGVESGIIRTGQTLLIPR